MTVARKEEKNIPDFTATKRGRSHHPHVEKAITKAWPQIGSSAHKESNSKGGGADTALSASPPQRAEPSIAWAAPRTTYASGRGSLPPHQPTQRPRAEAGDETAERGSGDHPRPDGPSDPELSNAVTFALAQDAAAEVLQQNIGGFLVRGRHRRPAGRKSGAVASGGRQGGRRRGGAGSPVQAAGCTLGRCLRRHFNRTAESRSGVRSAPTMPRAGGGIAARCSQLPPPPRRRTAAAASGFRRSAVPGVLRVRIGRTSGTWRWVGIGLSLRSLPVKTVP